MVSFQRYGQLGEKESIMSSRKTLSMAARYAEKKQDVPHKETRTIIRSIESKRHCRVSSNEDKKHKDELSWED